MNLQIIPLERFEFSFDTAYFTWWQKKSVIVSLVNRPWTEIYCFYLYILELVVILESITIRGFFHGCDNLLIIFFSEETEDKNLYASVMITVNWVSVGISQSFSYNSCKLNIRFQREYFHIISFNGSKIP